MKANSFPVSFALWLGALTLTAGGAARSFGADACAASPTGSDASSVQRVSGEAGELEIYKPREFASMDFEDPASRWSFARSRQSEHFVVFWEPGFGEDPNAESIPEELRVDVDDLLAKVEGFYRTNTEKLGFRGEGKSYLDQYKMEIYLLWQKEWLATGAGYDDVIGALWVNPSTCKPVGATIAHEIGHSFQYQVCCDRLLNGAAPEPATGFRYAHRSPRLRSASDAPISGGLPRADAVASSAAAGVVSVVVDGYEQDGLGNALWEQCAQWQASQDYPEDAFAWYHRETWAKNCHRAFENEWFRYQSYWFLTNVKELHGQDAVGKVWNNAVQPDDFIDCYLRLFLDGDVGRLNDELYRYASHAATFDFDGFREILPDEWRDCYAPCFYPVNDNPDAPDAFQIGYASCPDETGFNVLPIPADRYVPGEPVAIRFTALPVGAPTAPGDPGEVRRGGNSDDVEFVTKNYNSPRPDVVPDHRYGFVALLKDGSRVYGPMNRGGVNVVEFKAPADAERLYFVVAGAATKHYRHVWNEKESDDIQLPYRIEFVTDKTR